MKVFVGGDQKLYETLGTHIRGARLGFRWVAQFHAYLRVSDGPLGRISVEVAPPNQLPNRPYGKDYRVWWEEPNTEWAVLDAVERTLVGDNRLTSVKTPLHFFLDDQGQFVGAA